ncbi:MAG TPA: hypothetical protein VJT31_14465 [Rugosimonospora sp.]|nr:hypothetical protein [Rugosimonospora sp.]
MLGISDTGVITGFAGSGNSTQGFTVSGSSHNNWSWMRMPGAVQTTVVAVSANGTVIVGFFVTRTGAHYGFVRSNGRSWSVAYPHSSFSQLTSVNNNGMATGWYRDSSGRTRSFLYNTRTRVFIIIVVPMRATTVIVTGINNTNTIVGFIVTGRVTIAFVITRGRFITLVFGNRTNTRAMGVNNSGTVVGVFVDVRGRSHGFMWTSTGMHQIDAPWGSRSTVITGINNRGQLVGVFVDSRGRTRGVVIVFVVVQSTNFWWNGRTMTPMTPPSGTPVQMPGSSSAADNTQNANSGHHF